MVISPSIQSLIKYHYDTARAKQSFARLPMMDAHRTSLRNSFRLCKAWGRNGSSVIYGLLTEGGLKHSILPWQRALPVTNALISRSGLFSNAVQGQSFMPTGAPIQNPDLTGLEQRCPR